MATINIVLITYNRPIYLEKAINSILDQSFNDFKLIVLDNGSDSPTKVVLNSFNDNRIFIIYNEYNSKEFINKAFGFLDSKYLMITHDDDEMDSNLLENQIKELESNSNIDLLACRINLIDENSNNISKIRPRIFSNKIWKKGDYINQYFFSGNIIPCPTIIVRCDFVKKHKLKYNFIAGPAADLYMLFEANINGVLALSKKALYNYRIHPNQDSGLNKISLELKVKSEIINLLNINNLNNLVVKYNSASNGIILNILFEGLISKKTSFLVFKKYTQILLRDYNLNIDRYTVYWSFVGILRGINNRFK